jgi:hypothetical protein
VSWFGPQRFVVNFTQNGKNNTTTVIAENRHIAGNHVKSLFGEGTEIISAKAIQYQSMCGDWTLGFKFF